VRSIQRPVRRKFGTAPTKDETKSKKHEWDRGKMGEKLEGRKEKNLY
jgi:hypothetical protein